MNVDKIPTEIYEGLQKRCTVEEIKGCSPEYLFNEYCEFEGLRGWGDDLISTLDSLRAADK